MENVWISCCKWLLDFGPLGKVAHISLGFLTGILVVTVGPLLCFVSAFSRSITPPFSSCINAFSAVSLDILSYTVLCQDICQQGNRWSNQWENTRIILMKWKLFHCIFSFSLFPFLLFSLIEACNGVTVLIELAHHHPCYINVVHLGLRD